MLEFIDVSKVFGKREILYAISFTLPERGLVGLFGRSGSGKTTILKMIKGFERPSTGRIESTVPNKDIVFLNQSIDDFDTITLNFYFKMLGIEDKEKINELLHKFMLSSKMEQKINTLSNGEKKRLQIITAILLQPKVLLLDEPFSGLDEENILLIIPSLMELSKRSLVIISTHQEKETIPFDMVLEVKRKKVTFIKNESLKETTQEEQKDTQITTKGMGTFFSYLWKKSLNLSQVIYLLLLAICYSVGIIGTSLDHFDRFSAACHYYEDNSNIPILIKKKGSRTSKPILEYSYIEKCPYMIVSTLLMEEESEFDTIAIASKGLEEDEVILSSALKDTYSDTIIWEEKEYRIHSYFDFTDVKMMVLPKEYIEGKEKDVKVADQEGQIYQIQAMDIKSHEIILPKELSNDRLYHIGFEEYYEMDYEEMRIEESDENIIYVSLERYEEFFYDFSLQEHIFINKSQTKGFVSYMKKNGFDFADEGIIEELARLDRIHYGKSSLSYSIIMTTTIAIFVLFFASTKHIDRQIVEREYQYLAFKGYKTKVEIMHVFIHFIYSIFAFLLAVLARNIFCLFRKNNIVIRTLYYLASPFALRRVIIIFVGSMVISFLYFFIKKKRKKYSYINTLKKEE